MKGICEICNREYANLYQHKQSARYKKALGTEQTPKKEKKEKKELKSLGVVTVDKTITEPIEPVKQVTEPTKTIEPASTIAGIQIIDGNTAKKQLSTLDTILEKAFSEQYLPLTTSIIGALTAKLAPTNTESHEGMIQTELGEWVAKI